MSAIFIDCEFNGFFGDLISLAMVCRDESLYLVHHDPEYAYEEWVAQNVVPILYSCPVAPEPVERSDWGRSISSFLYRTRMDQNQPINIVADWPDDIRHLCAALIVKPGWMVNTPDLNFCLRRVDAYPTELEGAVRHNAYWDAKALQYLVEKNN